MTRSQRIEKLRLAIQSGTYEIPVLLLAAAILRRALAGAER